MKYRRLLAPGGCYFFTLTTANKNSQLLTQHIDTLRASFSYVKQRHPFVIEAMVVMPNHLHSLWTLPQDDHNYSMRWNLIKGHFSRALKPTEQISPSRYKKSERGIWQRRFWEHLIRDEKDFEQHINYIHYNPVKHGFTASAAAWPYSSIHRYIRQGLLDADWAGGENVMGSFGE